MDPFKSNTPSTEIPANEVPAPTPVQTPPAENPAVPAAPPSAELVEQGEVNEQEFSDLQRQLDEERRRTRELETQVSERERDIQELKKIPTVEPQPRKEKRKRYGPIIGRGNRESE